jgi:hypothetical protein
MEAVLKKDEFTSGDRVVGLLQPTQELGVHFPGVTDTYTVGDHDIPRTRSFQPAGRGDAFELDSNIKSFGGRGL